jgi:hypothetical protein
MFFFCESVTWRETAVSGRNSTAVYSEEVRDKAYLWQALPSKRKRKNRGVSKSSLQRADLSYRADNLQDCLNVMSRKRYRIRASETLKDTCLLW